MKSTYFRLGDPKYDSEFSEQGIQSTWADYRVPILPAYAILSHSVHGMVRNLDGILSSVDSKIAGDVVTVRGVSDLTATTEQIHVTLPTEVVEAIRAKVQSGVYATESDVIRGALSALLGRERAIDGWLQDQVGPAGDALKANPARGVSADHVRLGVSQPRSGKERRYADVAAKSVLRDFGCGKFVSCVRWL